MLPASTLLVRLVRAIDRFTDFTGTCVAWLIIPLVLIVGYEVFARYLLNAPTLWAFELTYMLYAAVFMLGAAYALHKGAHIRTDFLWEKFSIRKKGVIDSIAYIVFFFPSLAVFLYISAHEAWYAYEIQEASEQTAWRPLLWPLKAVIPLTAALLLIQGVSELFKSLHAARTGVELEHKEKVEV